MKKTHKQLIECLLFLNDTNSIAQTAQKYGVSKQTLYNLFYRNKAKKKWEFKPEYLAQWYEIYSTYKTLLTLVCHNKEFKCTNLTLSYLQILEMKMEDFNEREISVM